MASIGCTITADSDTADAVNAAPSFLLGPSYAEWADGLAQAGQTDDPDADRLANLLEYASGTDPRSLDPNPASFALETSGEDGFLTLSYQKNLAATDLDFQVEQTEDLIEWEDVADSLVSSAGGIETRKASVPRTGSGLWLRLRVELLPPP